MKILVVTVGGSCAPIVTSIEQNAPNKVIFICSGDDKITGNKGSYVSVEGAGNVCGRDFKNPDKPNIVKQTELSSENYEVHKLEHYDDHNECYKFCFSLLRQLQKEHNNAEIIADYTGGTKSMTVGLVTAASDIGDIIIAIVKGDRSNLVKVDDGTERVSLSRTNYSTITKQVQMVDNFINSFDYASAQTILKTVFNTTKDIPNDLDNILQTYYSVAKIFDAWDKFNHEKAYKLLRPMRKKYPDYALFLAAVISSRATIDNKFKVEGLEDFKPLKKISGYEIVEDLIFNAQRRANQERYDDAIARLYRSLELFVQIYLLKTYQIETSNVVIGDLPETIKEYYTNKQDSKGKIKLGLMESYELLAKLNDTIVAPSFTANKTKLLTSLGLRNFSILAHGFAPISKDNYNTVFKDIAENFLHPLLNYFAESRNNITPQQFPTSVTI